MHLGIELGSVRTKFIDSRKPRSKEEMKAVQQCETTNSLWQDEITPPEKK